MSCSNYDQAITELARNQILDLSLKRATTDHLNTCARCAARFSAEQVLNGQLRTLDASSDSLEAPARVEAALMAAFHEHVAAPVVTSVPLRTNSKRVWLWSVAAAATVALVTLGALAAFRLTSGTSELTPAAVADQEGSVHRSPVEKKEGDEETLSPQDASFPAPASEAESDRHLPRRRLGRDVEGRNGGNAAETIYTGGADPEMTTDFFPLTHASNLSQMDGGQLVRVELPRSALQSVGLPLNPDYVGERVKADVLLGHDGLARAIRFVR